MNINRANIPLVLAVSAGVYIATLTASVVWWASDANRRIAGLEQQTKAQWERLSALGAIDAKVSRIDERTRTIMDIMESINRR